MGFRGSGSWIGGAECCAVHTHPGVVEGGARCVLGGCPEGYEEYEIPRLLEYVSLRHKIWKVKVTNLLSVILYMLKSHYRLEGGKRVGI